VTAQRGSNANTPVDGFQFCFQYVVLPPDVSKVAPVDNEHSSLASQQAIAVVSWISPGSAPALSTPVFGSTTIAAFEPSDYGPTV
jgi:hypothetical protein